MTILETSDLELNATIDPKNKYEKAKKALIESKILFEQLTPQEQQQLACEFIGAEGVNFINNLMNQIKQ